MHNRTLKGAGLAVIALLGVACGGDRSARPSTADLNAETLTRTVAASLLRGDTAWQRRGEWRRVFLTSKTTPVSVYPASCRELLAADETAQILQRHEFVSFADSTDGPAEFTSSGEPVERSSCVVRFPDVVFNASKNEAPRPSDDHFFVREPQGTAREGLWLNFRVARYDVDSVTGIVQEASGTDARVEYRWRFTATSFSKDVALNPDTLAAKNDVAMFRRYDDGWRVISQFGAQ